VNEVAVHFARNRMDAEVAASALRAEQVHPRIAPDPAGPRFTGDGMTTAGRWLVYVPEDEESRAREILDEPVPDAREDNPVLRLVVIVALITGLLLATPFVAQVCYAPR
jgi:hypothetical protein